ncbi:hypothetical protein FNF29_01228 [Cafeteria roenbergensis]|uniref:Cytoplasmic tRNA 2-thiolation protein 1 n=1 Tax=Cafeteria roenbergensis TaxID=33653 RepID=A0A5A8CTN9_CAFRO|nr:hypothetical protein FNF29_01228 [Cafeteria roenbergensis]|eukprot:KAA0156436.1 hypothetical protein FNF29_01228 [Cafeteria roenbergensis]
MFHRGQRVALAASGGKDSTVLIHVMTKLNKRYDYGLNLFLLSVDEGITGYRDDSLETVKRNSEVYGLPLRVVSYAELYDGWTMDRVVRRTGLRSNCTYCGVFRRSALERGARLAEADMVATGHNADDVAETVLMNLLRGDSARLARCVDPITAGDTAGAAAAPGVLSAVPRCKPLMGAYEKEIVLYAFHNRLDYFSTECVYSPNAYRGFAREFVKGIEAARPSSILDTIRAGEGLAPLFAPAHRPGATRRADAAAAVAAAAAAAAAEAEAAEAGTAPGAAAEAGTAPGAAAEAGTAPGAAASQSAPATVSGLGPGEAGSRVQGKAGDASAGGTDSKAGVADARGSAASGAAETAGRKAKKRRKQREVRACDRCGQMTSQRLCQTCTLLESLEAGGGADEVDGALPVAGAGVALGYSEDASAAPARRAEGARLVPGTAAVVAVRGGTGVRGGPEEVLRLAAELADHARELRSVSWARGDAVRVQGKLDA